MKVTKNHKQLSLDFESPTTRAQLTSTLATARIVNLNLVRRAKQNLNDRHEEQQIIQKIKESVAHLM